MCRVWAKADIKSKCRFFIYLPNKYDSVFCFMTVVSFFSFRNIQNMDGFLKSFLTTKRTREEDEDFTKR